MHLMITQRLLLLIDVPLVLTSKLQRHISFGRCAPRRPIFQENQTSSPPLSHSPDLVSSSQLFPSPRISKIMVRFRSDSPPLYRCSELIKLAPTKSHSRKSSTVRCALAHKMESAWKMRTCCAGASCSQSQGRDRYRLTPSRDVRSNSFGMIRTWIRPSSTARRQLAEPFWDLGWRCLVINSCEV